LPDLRHLFHRRTDKGGQTFPSWLSNNPKAATKIARRIHDRVARQRPADFLEGMIEREVTRNDLGSRARLACWFRRLAKTNFQNVPALLHVNRAIANHPVKTVADFFPVKYLAGIQGHSQVEDWRFDCCQVHWRIEQSSQFGSDLDAIL